MILYNDDREVLLQRQYEKLNFAGIDTAMAVYLNPAKYKAQVFQESNPIFLFGGNASQFKVIRNALK